MDDDECLGLDIERVKRPRGIGLGHPDVCRFQWHSGSPIWKSCGRHGLLWGERARVHAIGPSQGNSRVRKQVSSPCTAVLDGVYRSDAEGEPEFIEAAAPTTRHFTRCCTPSSRGS